MTVLVPIIPKKLLTDNGIDPSSIQLRPQTYDKSAGLLQDMPIVPVHKTVVDSGTYSINVEDHNYTTLSHDAWGNPLTPKTYTLQSDQVEIQNQNNIFARVTTDETDKVKLDKNADGSGWTEVPVQQSTELTTGRIVGLKRRLYVNTETNSAVEVLGDGTVDPYAEPSVGGDTTFEPPHVFSGNPLFSMK